MVLVSVLMLALALLEVHDTCTLSLHSSLSAVIAMAQAVPNVCVNRKVFLNYQVNWDTVCGAIRKLPWRYTWLSDNPLEVLNEHLSLMVGRYVPTKVIRVRNKDKPWFDDQCRHAFGLKQVAHLRWTHDRSRVNLIFHLLRIIVGSSYRLL